MINITVIIIKVGINGITTFLSSKEYYMFFAFNNNNIDQHNQVTSFLVKSSHYQI